MTTQTRPTPPPSVLDALRALRAKFVRTAGPKAAEVLGIKIPLAPFDRPTGALGYAGTQDIFVEVDGQHVRATVSVTVTLTGSHKWPR